MIGELIMLWLTSSIESKIKQKEEEERLSRRNDKIIFFKARIKEHFEMLLYKKNQKVYLDDYGQQNWDGFDREAKKFIKNVIYRNKDYKVTGEDLQMFYEIFRGEENNVHITISASETSVKTGIDYENLVYNKLQDSGFEVQKTPTTGDQGVDLITSKNGKRCAIQCKFYSSAVGNKAVQEVIAGKGYYSCEYAVVCSNNDFTKSARQLANNQGVILASEMNIVEKINELFSAPNSEKSTSNIKEEIESDFKDDVEENYIMENFIK